MAAIGNIRNPRQFFMFLGKKGGRIYGMLLKQPNGALWQKGRSHCFAGEDLAPCPSKGDILAGRLR